jgi:hypothetical protein
MIMPVSGGARLRLAGMAECAAEPGWVGSAGAVRGRAERGTRR